MNGAGGIEALGLVAKYVVKQLDIGVARSGFVQGVAIQREKLVLQNVAFQVQQGEADALGLDRKNCQMVGVLVQAKADGPPTGQRGLRGTDFVDQLAVSQLLHQHRDAGGAQVHVAHDLGPGFAFPAAHQIKNALDIGFLDLLLIAGMSGTKFVLRQVFHRGSLPLI